MKTSSKEEIAVIGAGIIGVCCAFELVRRGFRVKLIDPEPPCSLTSFGNAGVISPWSCTPQSMPGNWKKIPKWLLDPKGPVFIRKNYLLKFLPWAIKFLNAGKISKINSIADAMFALTNNSVENYRLMLEGTGKKSLVKDSLYVHAYRNKLTNVSDQLGWKLRKKRNVPVELIDQNELKKLEPSISNEFESGIIIKEQGRASNPALIGQAIFLKAKSLGLDQIKSKVNQINFVSNNNYEIEFDTFKKNFNNIVLAAGVWSANFLKKFNINVPLEAERGYHLVCKNPGIEVNNSVMDVERMFVASSMDSGVRVAGTAEFAGINAEPNYKRAEIFKELIKNLFPEINTNNTEEWMGSRPAFPDSLPTIGEIKNFPGLYVAFGHGHYGLSMAPMTAKIIADCINNLKHTISLKPYDINRF